METANRNARLALNGPEARASDEAFSVTSSQAFASAADRIQDAKVGNIISLMDSVLRRNNEDEDDDVLFGDCAGDDTGVDIFASHQDLLKELRVDFTFNRAEHQYQ